MRNEHESPSQTSILDPPIPTIALRIAVPKNSFVSLATMADLNINSATGESVSQGRSPRFSLWIAFLVFSTITLGSSVEIVSREGRNPSVGGFSVVTTYHKESAQAPKVVPAECCRLQHCDLESSAIRSRRDAAIRLIAKRSWHSRPTSIRRCQSLLRGARWIKQLPWTVFFFDLGLSFVFPTD
jgi:hypothetical protein